MPASQKIITKLRERRQIEADMRELLTARSDLDLQRQAQEIASLGSQVIPTIIGNLDQADARMLAAMGVVSTFLDHDEITAALRQAVLHPQRTDHGRIAAMTILERFLHQPPDDDLLTSLRDPQGMAVASLDDVLDQAERNRTILIQYIEELDQQEPDVVLAIVRSLRELGSQSDELGQARRAVEPLHMMAQDVREEIAAEALRALGTIRLPEAVRALQALVAGVDSALQPLAERLLRKLQFSGVKVAPLPVPDPGWRALVSPVDGLGQQSVWFIQENRVTAHAQFLNILLSDRGGAFEAVGHSHVPVAMLPPSRPVGYLHDIAQPDGSGAMIMLEAPFDLGRRLVREALGHNRESQIPVAGPLRLLSPWLWGYAGADLLPARVLPDLPARSESLAVTAERLLEHPAFLTWNVRSDTTLQAAAEALRHPGWDLEVWVRRLTTEFFGEPAVTRVLRSRLIAMSEWLMLSGDEDLARLALAAANKLLGAPPQEQALLLALVRRDLTWALQSLQENNRPVSGRE
jgi:hypothetical protein